jgi:hypothetical protein
MLNSDDLERETDAQWSAISGGVSYEREILIALQSGAGENPRDLGAQGVAAMAAQIEASPTRWRWWIRRHPTSVLARGPSLFYERARLIGSAGLRCWNAIRRRRFR